MFHHVWSQSERPVASVQQFNLPHTTQCHRVLRCTQTFEKRLFSTLLATAILSFSGSELLDRTSLFCRPPANTNHTITEMRPFSCYYSSLIYLSSPGLKKWVKNRGEPCLPSRLLAGKAEALPATYLEQCRQFKPVKRSLAIPAQPVCTTQSKLNHSLAQRKRQES